jgi:hypothetical protein
MNAAPENILTEMKDFLGSPIAYYPALATLFCGDVKAALFVSQFLYWQKIKGEGEEIYKTIAELKRETGLSREEQDRIIKALVAAELLTVKVKGTPPKRYFGFDWAKITAGLSALNAKENISELKQIRAAFAQKSVTKGNNQFAANTQIEMRETHKSICVKGTNEFAASTQNKTYTTTENTTKITDKEFALTRPLLDETSNIGQETKQETLFGETSANGVSATDNKPAKTARKGAKSATKGKGGENIQLQTVEAVTSRSNAVTERVRSAHSFAVEIWFRFIQSRTGTRPVWTTEGGKEGKALKAILTQVDSGVAYFLEKGLIELPTQTEMDNLPILPFGGEIIDFTRLKKHEILKTDGRLFALIQHFGGFFCRFLEWDPFHQKNLTLSAIASQANSILQILNRNFIDIKIKNGQRTFQQIINEQAELIRRLDRERFGQQTV